MFSAQQRNRKRPVDGLGIDGEPTPKRLRGVAQKRLQLADGGFRRPHALDPVLEVEPQRPLALHGRLQTRPLEQRLPLAQAVVAHVGGVAQRLDPVQEGVCLGRFRRDAVHDQQHAAGHEHARGLFERTPEANLLRVQVDTLDRPFDVNSGLKLDLGSTAKLRTTIHYLEVVEGLHARYAGLDAAALREQSLSNRDDARYEVALAKLRLARAVGVL